MPYAQIPTYGRNDLVGNVCYNSPSEEQQFQKPYSEETGRIIDHEARKMIANAYDRTQKLLNEKRDCVEKVAQLLLEKEVLNREDMVNLLGKRPFAEKTQYEEFVMPNTSSSSDNPSTISDQPSK
ncbi:AAA ATPase afg3 [Basidiobolus ranarum]|uniref:AAA ATPase afg3 n=1 Tax=Basidiobolus ranarum TaxID=34480 RepID=A0ABR2VZZ5_9FUNG